MFCGNQSLTSFDVIMVKYIKPKNDSFIYLRFMYRNKRTYVQIPIYK